MRNTVLVLLVLASTTHAAAAEYESARAAMVAEIQHYATLARDADDAKFDDNVITAMAAVKRHEFVPRSQQRHAYENRPLPIGHGQTISQPYIVALMTELVEADPDDVILEIGTGSGYQAAIVAKLVDHVYSIEIIQALANEAQARLTRLGYDNVTTKLADGYYGWEEHAPFDAIIVTAAASHVPPPLIQQLKPGGRMVIPVGGRFMTQQLLLLEKVGEDEIVTRQISAVRFVPLTGDH